jgi:tRNA threonylcarbamoyladenosine biosynthesis protein TsaE
MKVKKILKSASQTKRFAADLVKKILKKKHYKHAAVLGLVGELGAGKTTFIQGFARGLGIKGYIPSPTFLIFRKYKIPTSRFMIHNLRFLYHVDLYRVQKIKELKNLGFQSILHSPFNIVFIEWADKIRKVLPKDTIWIKFEHGQKINERIIRVFTL